MKHTETRDCPCHPVIESYREVIPPQSYADGYRAALEAESSRDNPHPLWSFDRDQWSAGYEAGRRARAEYSE